MTETALSTGELTIFDKLIYLNLNIIVRVGGHPIVDSRITYERKMMEEERSTELTNSIVTKILKIEIFKCAASDRLAFEH